MPNHVHLIPVPSTADRLARAIGETRRRYTGFVNVRSRRTGHLFQGASARSYWTKSTWWSRHALWRSIPRAPPAATGAGTKG